MVEQVMNPLTTPENKREIDVYSKNGSLNFDIFIPNQKRDSKIVSDALKELENKFGDYTVITATQMPKGVTIFGVNASAILYIYTGNFKTSDQGDFNALMEGRRKGTMDLTKYKYYTYSFTGVQSAIEKIAKIRGLNIKCIFDKDKALVGITSK